MALTPQFSEKELEQFLLQCQRIIVTYITTALKALGEDCVNKIRDRASIESWIDRTANLRSSIAYAVTQKGEQALTGGFKTVLGAKAGEATAKAFLKSLLPLYTDTYALIVIAGMEYAEYVEAIEGKDVIASTRMWAEAEIEKRLNYALQRAENRINKLKI